MIGANAVLGCWSDLGLRSLNGPRTKPLNMEVMIDAFDVGT